MIAAYTTLHFVYCRKRNQKLAQEILALKGSRANQQLGEIEEIILGEPDSQKTSSEKMI